MMEGAQSMFIEKHLIVEQPLKPQVKGMESFLHYQMAKMSFMSFMDSKVLMAVLRFPTPAILNALAAPLFQLIREVTRADLIKHLMVTIFEAVQGVQKPTEDENVRLRLID